ncbi:MAG: conjugal transfer protein [Deltaproteobacteria bacterium]|nr:conjugal transfer protein [Deltaproteobacteria bacterium]
MTKIFWVACPECNGKFYCQWHELRHKRIQLLCPYCGHRFLDEESPEITE